MMDMPYAPLNLKKRTKRKNKRESRTIDWYFNGIVIVDEVYQDFTEKLCIRRLEDYPNLVVLVNHV
jgi:histidinol-phosphate/aromatic aminotransferase/cobyric acid decarboxylase-like protein